MGTDPTIGPCTVGSDPTIGPCTVGSDPTIGPCTVGSDPTIYLTPLNLLICNIIINLTPTI